MNSSDRESKVCNNSENVDRTNIPNPKNTNEEMPNVENDISFDDYHHDKDFFSVSFDNENHENSGESQNGQSCAKSINFACSFIVVKN